MALTAKPSRPAPKATDPVDAFISKGGSVPVEAPAAKAARPPQHPLKFPAGDLFERLEKARSASAVRLPRNTFILQAIAEKLAREGF